METQSLMALLYKKDWKKDSKVLKLHKHRQVLRYKLRLIIL
jgi:hypothetical protein